MTKIKVLHVLGTLGLGGAETMVMNLFRSVDADLLDFAFVSHTNTSDHFYEEIIEQNKDVYYLPKYNLRNCFTYKSEWKKILADIDPNTIIHIHIRTTAKILSKTAQKQGFKTIVHSHAISNGNGVKGFLRGLLQIGLGKRSNCNVACSQEAGLFLFRSNFVVINNFINTKDYEFSLQKRKNLRRKMDVQNDLVLGHVGSFTKNKNQIFIIDILDKLIKEEIPTTAIFIGDGSNRAKVYEYAKSKGVLENTRFIGSRKDVGVFYNAFDLFLFPSFKEGQGMVVSEALMNRLPVIISQGVPNLEFYPQELLNQKELDHDTWAETIKMIYGNFETIHYRPNISISKLIDELDVDINIEKYCKLYKEVLKDDQ